LSKGGKKEDMNSEDSNSFWTNIFGQIRNIWSTIGLAIVLAVGEYIIDNADSSWTWKAAFIAAVGAAVKYAVTHIDHAKTEKAVQKAVEQTVITTQEVLEKKGEI
jgi:hypothetical protein